MSRRHAFFACALGLLLTLMPAALAAVQTVPVENFIRHPAFSRVTISPDGKYLAVVTSPKGTSDYQLAILPTRSVLSSHSKVTAHFGLRDYENFGIVTWVNDERLIASTIKQYGGFDRPGGTGSLYAINADGGSQEPLMGSRTGKHAANVYFYGLLYNPREPHSRNIIVYGATTNKPMAYWLDVYTGAHHRVASSPIPNGGLLADHEGNVRLAWGSNAKTGMPELYYRPAGSMDWQDKSALLGGKGATALYTAHAIMFTADDKAVYVAFPADNAAETTGLYRYDFDTGAKTLLYVNPVVDFGGLIESFNRHSIVGVDIMPGKPQVIALDTKAPRIQLLAGLQQALPDVQVAITSHTRDGSEAIVVTWGDTVPPTYYLYASQPKPQLTPLFHEVPWIKPDNLSPMTPISFQSRDGLTIHGYLTVPRGVKAKNLPMVVYVHGGPHGIRTDWGYSPTDFDSVAEQILANHGYAVLSLNYRGSGGYGLKFLTAGFRHWGDTMQNDLADGVAWAVKQGYANPQQVCIFGASYGGYAALMNPERFPKLYKCAVGYDGCYDLLLNETRSSDTARHAVGRLYMQTALGNDEAQLKAFSPAYNADKLTIPVFLLHGGRDVRCPVGGYDHMVAAIKKNGTPLKTLFYNNEGHGFYKVEHRTEAWKEMLAFFGKYIGPGVTAPSSNE